MSLGELWELVMDSEAWHAAIHGVTKSQSWLSDWTELNVEKSLKDNVKWARKKSMLLLLLSHFYVSNSVRPHRRQPPGSSVPGILQAGILEWVAISFSNACMQAKLLQSCLTLCDTMNSSLPGSSPCKSLGKNTAVGCHFLLQNKSIHTVLFNVYIYISLHYRWKLWAKLI